MCSNDDIHGMDTYSIARSGTYSPQSIYRANPVARHRGGADMYHHHGSDC